MSTDAKRMLRLEMRKRRAAIPAALRPSRAAALRDRLLGLQEVAGAGVVAAYLSFGTEMSTGPLLASLAERGTKVLVPYLAGGEIELASYEPGDELVATAYGPSEPAVRRQVDPGTVDVVVAPGLAFDRLGRRLGYGGGYYDRLLGRLRAARPGITVVGIGFSSQVVSEVPAGPLDARVDLVVTDREVIRVAPGQP